jgi:hypothetical protein
MARRKPKADPRAEQQRQIRERVLGNIAESQRSRAFGPSEPKPARRRHPANIGTPPRSGIRIGDKIVELPSDYGARKELRRKAYKESLAQSRNRAYQAKGPIGRASYQVGKGLPRIAAQAARNPLAQFTRGYRRNIGGLGGALAGAGALAIGALVGKGIESDREADLLEKRRQEELNRRARQDMLTMLGQQDYKQSLRQNINQNLAQLQQVAPDLYMRVAAGRLLPQGAVVIGGAPRQDLLNQLGMAMSNGQFSE